MATIWITMFGNSPVVFIAACNCMPVLISFLIASVPS